MTGVDTFHLYKKRNVLSLHSRLAVAVFTLVLCVCVYYTLLIRLIQAVLSAQQRVWHYLFKDTFKSKREK